MKELPRPSVVNEAQAKFLETHKVCDGCGSTTGIQAHHEVPFEYLVVCDRVWLASAQRIFRGLCETEENKPERNCHIEAHGFDFTHCDLHYQDKLPQFIQFKTFAEVKASPLYHQAILTRLPKASELTHDQIVSLTAFIDAKYPRPSA